MAAILSRRDEIARLRAAVAEVYAPTSPILPFDVAEVDQRLAGGGLDCHGLHECAPARPTLNDCAAATLFLAGIAARLAKSSRTILWALSEFDLYAPGLEQAGLSPDRLVYAEARSDEDVLALAEDGLRHGALAAVVAEVRKVGMTQTRRLQLAAAEGHTPMLLLRRWRRAGSCPLAYPSSAMTRWRIIDYTDLLGQVGAMSFPHRPGRGDGATHPGAPDRGDACWRPNPKDGYYRPYRTGADPEDVVRVKTRDFR